jgi:hypothetical protein
VPADGEIVAARVEIVPDCVLVETERGVIETERGEIVADSGEIETGRVEADAERGLLRLRPLPLADTRSYAYKRAPLFNAR